MFVIITDLVFKDKHGNPSDSKGWTPLHFAAANDQKKVWKLIADAMVLLPKAIQFYSC